MDEIWERAVETALDGESNVESVKTLTLDGAVKCVHGRLPSPSIFEKYRNLQHLSIANIGVSSLEQFPRLQNLQRLILSDNRIAGGLEFLVEAGLESLRDLDLSNNRIQEIDDLRPLAELKLASLDLYECPVTRMKDYRSRVFGLIKSLRYLDKMDADENERPESDEEEDEEDVEEDEDDVEDEEDDPGSGEIDGEDRSYRVMTNGHSGVGNDGVVDVDEDEESDADEEETETLRGVNGNNQHSNGFRVEAVGGENEEEQNEEDEEEIYEDEDDEDVVEVHDIGDSDDEEDGVEDEDDDDDDDDDDEDEEEVDNDEGDFAEPDSIGRITSTEGEIDAHEQGEDDEDDDGETGEEELGVEEVEYEEEEAEAEDEEEDDTGYLLQPVAQVEDDAGGTDMDAGNEEDDAELDEEVEDEEDDEDGEVQVLPPSSSSQKRKRDAGDSDGGDDDEADDDDVVKLSKSSKPN